MRLHAWDRSLLPLAGLLVFGLTVLVADAGPVLAQEQAAAGGGSTRTQTIADIEQQIATLQKRLAELKQPPKEPAPAPAPTSPLPEKWVEAFKWRSIGPANMGGRIVSISVFEADPSTYWLATASGGLLKTENNGVTYEHQFEKEATVSIGDVCVAPSDKNIVWVGTGENNPRNSVSYGDGVYKSVDGGKTWTNMGLKKSFQIGRVIVHPKNPDIVYVGVLGRLYGPSEERGLYKTTNGGKTWDRILYVDDKTGVIDMRMNPADPETLLAATYERQRDLYDSNDPIKKWGPGAGLYKTTDGGKSFKKITKGLPTCNLGRIGIDYYRKDPKVAYLILESEKIGMGPPPAPVLGVDLENAAGGARVTTVVADGPAQKAGLKVGDVVTALGDKTIKTREDLSGALRSMKAGDKVKVKLTRANEGAREIEATLAGRPPQGTGNAYMGFQGEDAEGGARLTSVIEDGPAYRAGLQLGDLVVAMAGKPVNSYDDLITILRTHQAGQKAKVKFIREKAAKELEVTFGERPSGFGGLEVDPNRPFGAQLGGQRENVQGQQGPEGYQYGGVYQSTDGGESWTRINSLNPRPMYFSHVRVDPSDNQYLYVLGVSLYRSKDGGKTFTADGGRGVHADQHYLWIDPRDGRHMIVATDGGPYVTYDRMTNWDHHNFMAIGQFYHVAIDTRRGYRAYGGLQDNGTWGGPTFTKTLTGPVNEDWLSIGGGDGFGCRVDPNDPDQIYYTSQNGGLGRRNLRTGETGRIQPRPLGSSAASSSNAQDTQPGQSPRRGSSSGGTRFRFNWNTPFILSSHNTRIYYAAGNYVFRSLDQGKDLIAISPEITSTEKGSATALSESPRNPNVLWVGTDDGNLWVTRDGGREWNNVVKNVGLPKPCHVATIEASRIEEGRCYVCFDGHRSDLDDPFIFVTDDFGKSWKSLRGNLPWGSTRCLREDIQNPDLLFLGTEFAVWASVDRGTTWRKLNNNLPTVAVHELALHPTSGEMVAATHGRSLWVLDISPLRQMTKTVLKEKAHLYRPTTAIRWQSEPSRGRTNRRFAGDNPQSGANIYFSLTNTPDAISLKVLDVEGKVVRELTAPKEPGLHRLNWNLTRPSLRPNSEAVSQLAASAAAGQPPSTPASGRGSSATRGSSGRGGGFGGVFGQPVPPGVYRIVLTVDGQELTQTLRVENDPNAPTMLLAEEPEEDQPMDGGDRIDD